MNRYENYIVSFYFVELEVFTFILSKRFWFWGNYKKIVHEIDIFKEFKVYIKIFENVKILLSGWNLISWISQNKALMKVKRFTKSC